MAYQNLSQVLPYKFRNTGDKPGTVTNILQAPPLEIVKLETPIRAQISATIAYPGAKPLTIETYTDEYRRHSPIADLLDGSNPEVILWEVIVWTGRMELYFRDKCVRSSQTGHNNIVSSKIAFNSSNGMELGISAPACGLEPERRLICHYGIDAAWGKFIRISEASSRKGIQVAVFYPDAEIKHLEKIAKHGF